MMIMENEMWNKDEVKVSWTVLIDEGRGGTEWEKNSSWYISLVEVLQVLKPKNWKVDGLERRAAEFLIDEEGIMVE